MIYESIQTESMSLNVSVPPDYIIEGCNELYYSQFKTVHISLIGVQCLFQWHHCTLSCNATIRNRGCRNSNSSRCVSMNNGQCNICGKNVRKLREQKKMSQDQLAAKLQTEGLGVNQNSISRIETGKRVVADYELKVLADVLNASVDDLLEEEIHP